MKCFRTLGIAALGAFLAASLSTQSYAMGGCASLPVSQGWGKTDHEKIISYVSRKHDGDWAAYLAKWGKQLHSMRGIHERGGSAVFKSKGLTLSGDSLQQYIDDLVVRVEVTECLARNDAAIREARALNDMDTAAGGNAQ